jgi:hypothetical protein
VLALLDGIDWYAHMDYEKEQIATLRRLANVYLDNPSFVAHQNLHRSALAFMRGQDAGPIPVLSDSQQELHLSSVETTRHKVDSYEKN